MPSESRRTRAPWRDGTVPAVVTLAVIAFVWAAVRSENPDDSFFHPRFTIRVVDAASGAPVVGANVWATRVEGARSIAVPIWPHGPRRASPFGNPFGSVESAFTDSKGEVEIAAAAAAAGCTVHVGASPSPLAALLEAQLQSHHAPPADDAKFDVFPLTSGESYDATQISVVRSAPAEVRLHRTPIGTVTVRNGSRDGPPRAGVSILRGTDGGVRSAWRIEGTTNAEGIARILLPTSGSMQLSIHDHFDARDRLSDESSGTLDRAHPELVLFRSGPSRARIRLAPAGPLAGTRWTAYCRRAGHLRELAPTPFTTADEVVVAPEDPAGTFDVYLDGGDEGGRAIVRDVACPSETEFVPARGPRIRLSLLGVVAGRGYAAYADALDWFARRVVAAKDGPSALVFSSLPEGRWRVVVARAEDDVGRRELEVIVGATLVERTVDVSGD